MNVKFERKRPIIKAEIGQKRKQYKKIKNLQLKNYNKIKTGNRTQVKKRNVNKIETKTHIPKLNIKIK